MSNLSKALKMVKEGKSLEFISKSLRISTTLLEGMLRAQESGKKTADKTFMPRSFVKKDFTVLPTQGMNDETDDKALSQKRAGEERARKEEEEDKKAYELLRIFLQKYPKLFSIKSPKPFAIGIDKEILKEWGPRDCSHER